MSDSEGGYNIYQLPMYSPTHTIGNALSCGLPGGNCKLWPAGVNLCTETITINWTYLVPLSLDDGHRGGHEPRFSTHAGSNVWI